MAGIFLKIFSIYVTVWHFKSRTVTALAGHPRWQLCIDKCYHLNSKLRLTFQDHRLYCQSLQKHSKPVNFSSRLEQTIATIFSACRLVKSDNEPYWLDKYAFNNHTSTDCRSVMFSGNNAYIDQARLCSSLFHPLCEKDKSFCQNENNDNILSDVWVQVAGEGQSYMLSKSTYPYCLAKNYCETDLHGNVAFPGNYSVMTSLAVQLGITKQMAVEVWLDSPGIPCPSGGDSSGLIVRYVGPFVNLIEGRKANKAFRVLCEKNAAADLTTTKLTTQPTTTPAKYITQSEALSRIAEPNTSLFTKTDYTLSPTPQPGVGPIKRHQSSSTIRPQSASTTQPKSATSTRPQSVSATRPQSASTTRPQSASTKRSQLPVKIGPQSASTTRPKSAPTTRPKSASITQPKSAPTTRPKSAPTTRPKSAPTIRPQSASTTIRPQSVMKTRLQSLPTPLSQAASSTQQQATKPTVQHSESRQQSKQILAVSRTSEPVWLKVGRKEYFVNYNSSVYRENNIETNYFKILLNPQTGSFWIGAHTILDEEPSDADVTYIPYKDEPFRFTLAKEQVQSMWRELRRLRNTNDKTKKAPRN